MATYHKVFEVESEHRPCFHDVTGKVREILEESRIRDGIAVVYSQHTTCSVILQEDSRDRTQNGTLFLFQDLLNAFDQIIPKCEHEGQYLHPGPLCVEHSVEVVGETAAETLNTDAHLRSALMGRSESVPVVGGELLLGEHGHIYFADFDGTRPRVRKVHVQLIGD